MLRVLGYLLGSVRQHWSEVDYPSSKLGVRIPGTRCVTCSADGKAIAGVQGARHTATRIVRCEGWEGRLDNQGAKDSTVDSTQR